MDAWLSGTWDGFGFVTFLPHAFPTTTYLPLQPHSLVCVPFYFTFFVGFGSFYHPLAVALPRTCIFFYLHHTFCTLCPTFYTFPSPLSWTGLCHLCHTWIPTCMPAAHSFLPLPRFPHPTFTLTHFPSTPYIFAFGTWDFGFWDMAWFFLHHATMPSPPPPGLDRHGLVPHHYTYMQVLPPSFLPLLPHTFLPHIYLPCCLCTHMGLPCHIPLTYFYLLPYFTYYYMVLIPRFEFFIFFCLLIFLCLYACLLCHSLLLPFLTLLYLFSIPSTTHCTYCCLHAFFPFLPHTLHAFLPGSTWFGVGSLHLAVWFLAALLLPCTHLPRLRFLPLFVGSFSLPTCVPFHYYYTYLPVLVALPLPATPYTAYIRRATTHTFCLTTFTTIPSSLPPPHTLRSPDGTTPIQRITATTYLPPYAFFHFFTYHHVCTTTFVGSLFSYHTYFTTFLTPLTMSLLYTRARLPIPPYTIYLHFCHFTTLFATFPFTTTTLYLWFYIPYTALPYAYNTTTIPYVLLQFHSAIPRSSLYPQFRIPPSPLFSLWTGLFVHWDGCPTCPFPSCLYLPHHHLFSFSPAIDSLFMP